MALAGALATVTCGRVCAFDSTSADAIAHRVMRDNGISALEIGIYGPGGRSYIRGYGSGVSARAIFPIGSITKTFTAAAVVRLAEIKRIDLDVSICRYLPEYSAWCAVSVRDMLEQRSGIPDVAGMPWFDRTARAPTAPESLLGRIASMPLLFPPASRYDYSNTNFTLAAMIAAHATGTPYTIWLHRNFLSPLHLDATHVAWPFLKGARVRASLPLGSPTLAFGSADLESNAADVLTWGRALWPGGRFGAIGTQMIAAGFGLQPGRIDAHDAAWASGYVSGFSSFFAMLPRERIAVVVLANADRVDLAPLATSLLRLAEGEPD